MWDSDAARSTPARLAVLALVWPALAFGEGTPTVTDADIARARQMQPVITDADIARAQARYGVTALPQTAPAGPEGRVNVDALPVPRTMPPIDLEAVARGFSQVNAANPSALATSGPALLVFVSFSVPDATLRLLAEQAEQAGATLILRGLVDGSIPRTVTRVQSVIGTRRVAVQIDPQAFDRFAVTRAPTFALLHDGTRGQACTAGTCYPEKAVVTLAGDISLDYALTTMVQRAPDFARDAEPYLNRLHARQP